MGNRSRRGDFNGCGRFASRQPLVLARRTLRFGAAAGLPSLTGRVERLDEIDYGGRVRVEARLSAELTNIANGSRRLVRVRKPDVECRYTRNVNSVVTEMNTAVQESIQQLLAGMQVPLSSTGSATLAECQSISNC